MRVEVSLLLAVALAAPCARAEGISKYSDPNWKPDVTKSSSLANKAFSTQTSRLAGRDAGLKSGGVPLKAYPVGSSSLGGAASIGQRSANLSGNDAMALPRAPEAEKTFAQAGSSPAFAGRSFPTRPNQWSSKAAPGLDREYPAGSFEGKIPRDLQSMLDANSKPNLSVEDVKTLLNFRQGSGTASAEVKPEAGLPLGEGLKAQSAHPPAVPASGTKGHAGGRAPSGR